MDPIRECPIRRYDGRRERAEVDKVIAEARIELLINDGEHRVGLLCLPRDLEALAAGFLLAEGALRRREDLHAVTVDAGAGRVTVRGDFDADALEAASGRWTWGTGCGGGGTGRDLDAPAYRRLAGGPVVAPERLVELARALAGRESLWRQTGGVHACALAAADGAIVGFTEDVGRHNAFDKLLGRALLDGVDVADKLVVTTGRLSGEIVSKAVACGVCVLASRSAATSLAVALARRFALTLVGFLRGERFNVYAGHERIARGGGEGRT